MSTWSSKFEGRDSKLDDVTNANHAEGSMRNGDDDFARTRV